MERALIVACVTAVAPAGVAQTAAQGKGAGAIPPAHGAPGDPSPAAAASRVMTCEGLFGRSTTHAKLNEAFGPGNVTSEKEDGAEGESTTVSVLFKKAPADRLSVAWTDEKRRAIPASMTATTGSSALPSRWTLPNGLHPGSSLADVETANGRPFALSGFEWDYGGYATDWKGGSLAQVLGSCTISIRFNPGAGAKTDKVSGEATFLSSDPRMRAARPFVSTISLTRK